MSFDFFSKNNVILPDSQAVVPIDNIEYAYGFGVYETMKVRNGILYFAEQHADRLLHSAELIELEHTHTKTDIIAAVQELVDHLHIENANMKMMLIGGKTAQEADLYIFATAPLYPDRKLYKKGAFVTTAQYERWLPQAKSLNMLPSYLIYKKAERAGAYDALLIDNDGCIREGTRTNFFVIQGKTVISPPNEDILEGVTRKTIVHVLAQSGYTYREQKIPFKTVFQYDGAFLSSTSTKVMPIKTIDSHNFPSISDSLYGIISQYNDFLRSCNGIYPG